MSTLNVDKVDPSTGTALELGTSGDTITVPTGAGLTVVDEVKTNKVSPATGTAFALGDSGDTFTVPSGATIVNSGTATGFGAALTGSTNNTVTTVTAANAIQGEANLTFDGSTLAVTGAATITRDSTTAWAGHIENSASSNYGRVLKLVLDNNFDDNASVFMIAYGAAVEKFKVFSDGDVQNADNSYGGISDEKLKQDITDASSQWDDIKNIKVRKFKFKKDVLDKGDSEEHWRIGLVAQEAELVSPKLIKDNPDMDSTTNEFTGTTTKGIKYSILYMKAIKALQESMERIETLEAKVTALENA